MAIFPKIVCQPRIFFTTMKEESFKAYNKAMAFSTDGMSTLEFFSVSMKED